MKYFKLALLFLALFQPIFSQDEVGDLVGGWTPGDVVQCLADEDCKKALKFGGQFLANQGIQAGVLPDTAWTVSRIVSVDEQVVSGTHYRFHVVFIAPTGESFSAVFVVWSQPWTNTLELVSAEYFYDVGGSGEGEAGTEYEVNYTEDEGLAVWEFVNGETEGLELNFGWTEVNIEEITNDPNLQVLLNQGAAFTILQGEARDTLPNGNWTISSTNSIWKQDEADGANWRFDVTIFNGNQTWAELDYNVFQGANDNIEITSWAVNSVSTLND